MPEGPIVTVGAPMLPDPARLAALTAEALAAGWLTNGGALHLRLEQALAVHAPAGGAATLVSSGTMALMLALRLGGLPEGAEVITSPLSFAATAQAIAWCGFRPVFADVEPGRLTLCPRAVAAAVTPRTAAILPVHFLGVPCDVAGLAAVARRHGLWLVYDGAHAFGIALDGRPIGAHGDATAFSLHATKVLHSCEGGFVVTGDAGATQRLRQMRNFGLRGGQAEGPGTNGKLSELHAAMGLALLPDLPAEIAARHALRAAYDAALAGLPGLRLHPGGDEGGLTCYALRLAPGLRARLVLALAEARIFARDHFALLCGPGTPWPEAGIVTADGGPAVAPRVGPEVLCLPFHGRVTPDDVARIARIARQVATGQEAAP